MRQIYLDNNASTPIDPAAAAAMRPFLDRDYGNPSSRHWAGAPARAAIERARAQVAALIHAEPDEIVMTSGASEASNHAIKGVFFRDPRPGRRFVTTAVEHPATLEPIRFLERLGAVLEVLPVDRFGRVDPKDVERAIGANTALVTVMHANNEVGTLQPIDAIGAITRPRGVLFHVDASQSIGKVPVDVRSMQCDLLSIAGHKVYAPKGVGALYVRRGVELEPLIHGAGHESGRRSGTENVVLVVGFGQAAEVAQGYLESGGPAGVRELRDELERQLEQRFPGRVSFNGHKEERLPNTSSVNFIGLAGADLLARLEGVAASSGAACHAGRVELSSVLRAMGVPAEEGMGAIRFSLGRSTTRADLDRLLEALGGVLGG